MERPVRIEHSAKAESTLDYTDGLEKWLRL
jgi:hypothetical protein